MAKATLEFDLSNPDDKDQHNQMMHASDMACALWEIVYNSRKRALNDLYSLQDRGENISAGDAIEMYADRILGILEDHGLHQHFLMNEAQAQTCVRVSIDHTVNTNTK